MRVAAIRLVNTLLLAAVVLPFAAGALERVGPIDPSNGFPRWYQDTTGITLDLCVPENAQQADYCGLPEVPPQGFPESFPNNWVGEHFYWTAEASVDNGAIDALLVLALESTFAAEDPVPGDQVVFGRMRIRIDPLQNGLYRVYTPFGIREFNVTAGEINHTADIGIACQKGTFDCALQSDLGPFLLPSAAPGAAELPPVTFEGRQYIADPAVATPVTGSREGTYTLANGTTRNANIFLVERVSPGPAIVAETTLFNVSGRLFNGLVPANVKVDRAAYFRDGAGSKIEVYATGTAALPKRLPTGAPVSAIAPTLSMYPLPCLGPPGAHGPPAGSAAPLARYGNSFFAQQSVTEPPPGLCIAKTIPGEGTTYELVDPLGDQVFVPKAFYSPSTRTLEVQASSSDVIDSLLALGRFGDMAENVAFDNGVVRVVLPEGQGAPPSTVRVFSTQNGQGNAEVTTLDPGTVVPAPPTSVQLVASQPGPYAEGTPVTFVAAASGSAGYQYRFWLFDGDEWTIVRDYGPDGVYVLPGSTDPGTYTVGVWVRTNTASEAMQAQAFQDIVVRGAAGPPATAVDLASSLPSPQLAGTSVRFTAAAQGSSGYQYRFWLYDGVTWTIAREYSSDPTWDLPTDTAAGSYTVGVWVRTNPSSTAMDVQAFTPFELLEQ